MAQTRHWFLRDRIRSFETPTTQSRVIQTLRLGSAFIMNAAVCDPVPRFRGAINPPEREHGLRVGISRERNDSLLLTVPTPVRVVRIHIHIHTLINGRVSLSHLRCLSRKAVEYPQREANGLGFSREQRTPSSARICLPARSITFEDSIPIEPARNAGSVDGQTTMAATRMRMRIWDDDSCGEYRFIHMYAYTVIHTYVHISCIYNADEYRPRPQSRLYGLD
ncbi:uncharacterized protein PV07_06695 [Cladophialophora immunda]|uniref:Uncharacterized protein n=1 Tax=Cladophialophora immunda TaxID=569365 RepID=A0A0D2AP96_9EURO|nr:uncharacterized protein PV07_06695 [Cladophialophora immunda]KIW26907.1 hypothetical protein PV07_06695 [Cladophialophora immunda]